MAAFRALDDQFEAFAIALDAAHREAVVQIQGRAEAVEARTEVGGGRRDVHHHFLTDARLRHPS